MIRKEQSTIKKFPKAIALLSTELVLLSLSFFISLALLFIVIRKIFYYKEYTIDNKIFDYLSLHITATNTAIMQFFSFLGSQQFLVPAWLLICVYYLFIRKNKWYFIKLATIGASNLLLMLGLKFFFNRPRPLVPLLKELPGLSFPSGHSFMSLIFYGLVIYIIYRDVSNKWLKWFAIIMLVIIIFLIGFSRVYLRVHYSSDVIAGFCFGILSLMILTWMLRQIEKFNAKKYPQVIKSLGH